uniref:Catechol O-methyltransferase n=1 Tax=Laticauda laticaudata TaxID=8630 RepID=A0A8C5WNJ5_LATLA
FSWITRPTVTTVLKRKPLQPRFCNFPVGVSAGYNTLSMALVLPEDGRIVACEVNEDMASIGKPVWKEAGVLRKIDLRIKPAIETLEELLANGEAGTFDLAFIHADKESYNDYYEKCLRLIKKGKILVLDNVSTSEKVESVVTPLGQEWPFDFGSLWNPTHTPTPQPLTHE